MSSLFKDLRARVFTYYFKLVYRRGAVNIARDEKGLFTAFLQIYRKLAAKRCLAGALKSAHHYDRGRLRRNGKLLVGRAHQCDKLLVDYLYDLLRGIKAF